MRGAQPKRERCGREVRPGGRRALKSTFLGSRGSLTAGLRWRNSSRETKLIERVTRILLSVISPPRHRRRRKTRGKRARGDDRKSGQKILADGKLRTPSGAKSPRQGLNAHEPQLKAWIRASKSCVSISKWRLISVAAWHHAPDSWQTLHSPSARPHPSPR